MKYKLLTWFYEKENNSVLLKFVHIKDSRQNKIKNINEPDHEDNDEDDDDDKVTETTVMLDIEDEIEKFNEAGGSFTLERDVRSMSRIWDGTQIFWTFTYDWLTTN